MRSRAGKVLAFALVPALAMSCAEAPPPKPVAANQPFLRVLAGDAKSASGAAKDAASAAPAPPPKVDREFIRRLTLTKSFTYGTPVGATPTPDGKAVLFLRAQPRNRSQSLYELDLATGKSRELLTPDAVAKGPETLTQEERARRERMRVTTSGFTSFEMTKDGARVLVTLSGKLYVLTRATGQVKELKIGEGAAIDPHLSPDGKRVAYVRGADVYVVGTDDDAKEVAVTKGGTATRTHGLAEFVAQEELERFRGFWWSPDGTKLLYEEADSTKVDTIAIPDVLHPDREAERTRYPRPGRPNADVRFGVVSANGGTTTWVTWDREKLPYVATVTWDKAALAVYALDRTQRDGALLAVDAQSGKTTTLVTEHDDAWLNVDPSVPRFLPDGRFLWSTERSGEWALELRGAKGEAGTTLLPKGYRELVDVDAPRGRVTAVTGEEPQASKVESIALTGGPTRLVIELPDGTVGAHFGDGHDVYVSRTTWRNSPPRWYVHDLEGKNPVSIPTIAEDPGVVPQPEVVTVGPDAVRVAILRPQTFDKTRKYPVLDAAYGGPHHNQVALSSSQYLRDQWIADATDAIVVMIDARGTMHRGRAWERALKDKLGEVPLEGHVATLAELGKRFPEMDTTRVGIYGGSFGGYLSGLAVLARPDVYKVAVAIAPVVDWRDYDSCYTERYLGNPEANKAAYDAASLLTYAAPRKDQPVRPLLLIHGTADDNVHYAHTMKLVDAMERAGRPFELLPLVGITHLPYEPSMAEALWTKAADFLRSGLAK
jgi:dipeptidyl-peptidase 4